MLRSGDDYLAGIRDGRAVYIGKERVADVTDHPAFANAARMYAAMYDLKRADDMRDVLWVEDGGERIPAYFLKPCDRRDLEIRTAAHRAIAAFSHGLLGRSPDHVASSITGLAIGSSVFDRDGGEYAQRIEAYYRHARSGDLYLAYAILPPQGARKPELYQSADRNPPTLRVTAEDSAGRGAQRDEDAGDRCGVRRRALDRQHHPAGAEPGEGIGDLRGAGERARRCALGAQAVRRGAGDRVPQPALPPLRRIGLDDRLRRGARTLGARLRARQPRPFARHLCRDAGALHVEPPVERALRGQAQAAGRARLEDRPVERGARHPGGARGAGRSRLDGGGLWRHRRRPAPGLPADRERLCPRQPALHVCGDQLRGRALREDLRPGPHADGGRGVPDAGEHRRGRGPGARAGLRGTTGRRRTNPRRTA